MTPQQCRDARAEVAAMEGACKAWQDLEKREKCEAGVSGTASAIGLRCIFIRAEPSDDHP